MLKAGRHQKGSPIINEFLAIFCKTLCNKHRFIYIFACTPFKITRSRIYITRILDIYHVPNSFVTSLFGRSYVPIILQFNFLNRSFIIYLKIPWNAVIHTK